MSPKKGNSGSDSKSSPSQCRHGGPRLTSHIFECINIMVNHSEFGITEDEVAELDGDETKVPELLLRKMCSFVGRHPEAAGDDSIKTLTALAIDAMVLDGDLECARTLFQPVPFLEFFKKNGLDLETNKDELVAAAEKVNSLATESGMVAALKEFARASCKCLDLYTRGKPLAAEEDDKAGLSYAEAIVAPFHKIRMKGVNQIDQDSRLHVEMRRLCESRSKPPYLCIVLAPATRFICNSFAVEETDADSAFMHILEGVVAAVVTEGMGMVDEEARVRPEQLTTADPLLASFLAPLLAPTRVGVAPSTEKVVNAEPQGKAKQSPLISIVDGVFADACSELVKPHSSRKLPLGDSMADDAKYKVKGRTATGREKYTTDAAAEARHIPDRIMACKGCRLLFVRSEVKQCSLCNEAWYCTSECQATDWNGGHSVECNRKNEGRLRGRGQASEDSGDDVEQNARNEALGTFTADIAAQLPGGAAGARKKAAKKGKAKKKKR